MPLKAEDVLFRDDLEPAFDEAAALAEMDALAEKAEDWRDHIPYPAALNYHEDPELLAQYEPHVDSCAYCQRLIDALHPSDRLIGELQTLRRQIDAEEDGEAAPRRGFASSASSFNPLPLAAAVMVGVVGTWLFLNNASTSGSLYKPDDATIASFLMDPDQLEVLEASNDAVSKFRAAKIYLATEHSDLAYQRIGEGFALANVGDALVQRVVAAPELPGDPKTSLEEAARELSALSSKPRLADEEQLRVMQLQAQLGQHSEALSSLKSLLESQQNAASVIQALEAASLVDSQ
jgi:hypothetical protein